MTDMQVNDIVIFSPRPGEIAEGRIARVWDKPLSDPYVTIKTGDGPAQTFVRCSSEVRARPVSHLTRGCTCEHKPGHPCDSTCPVHVGAGA